MKEQELTILLDKYITGELSAPERARLAELVASPASDAALETFAKEVMMNEEVGTYDDPAIAAAIMEGLGRGMRSAGEAKKRRVLPMRRMAAAAVVMGLLVGGIWMWKRETKTAPETAKVVMHDVAPGQKGAVLTLADGSRIVLDSSGNGNLAQQGEASVVKQGAGELTYKKMVTDETPLMYNTLTTPRGRRASVVLSDGTRVWLNAGSSIRFPTVFHGRTREVEITGEVYFDVARDRDHAFIVDVNKKMQVEVMGTAFNITAYSDEKEMVTTLVEGTVKVKSGKDSMVLHPGWQALLSGDGAMRKAEQVDLQKVVAWKDGNFFFKSDELSVIMRQLSRWYDIDVHFDGEVSDHYTGKISRQVNISQVLKMLQAAGGVDFSVNDREVRVSPRAF